MKLTTKKRRKALKRYLLMRQVLGMPIGNRFQGKTKYYLDDDHFYTSIANFQCKSQLQWEHDRLDPKLLVDSIRIDAEQVALYHSLRSRTLSGRAAADFMRADEQLKFNRFATIMETFQGRMTRELLHRIFPGAKGKAFKANVEDRYPDFYTSPKYGGPAILPQIEPTSDHMSEQLALQEDLLGRIEYGSSGTQTREQAGFVYVAVSPAYPGWVKVGSTLNLKERLTTFNIYSPFADFKFEHFQFFPDRVAAEDAIHELLEEHQGEGEWFQVNMEIAKKTIQEYLDEKDLEISEKVVDANVFDTYKQGTNAVQ